jgi:hypothetical protein
MEARIARLEASVEHLERDVTEMKIDVRSMRDRVEADFRITWAGIMALGLGLAGLMAKGFGWL